MLEREDVAHICSTEAVDRVVRDEPIGDEVVGWLDVDVIDRLHAKHVAPDLLNHIEPAVLVEHHHAWEQRSRWSKGQRGHELASATAGAAETGRERNLRVHLIADLLGQAHHLA